MLIVLFGSFMFTKVQADWVKERNWAMETPACGNSKHPSGCKKFVVPARVNGGGSTIHIRGFNQTIKVEKGKFEIANDKGLYCMEHSNTSSELMSSKRKTIMFCYN